MTYRVHGTAHGSTFDESGFPSWEDARDYASQVIDGDLDSDVQVTKES